MIETASLRSNAYLGDILQQPAVLGRTLAALAAADFSAFRALAARLASGELRRLVLTGMGASYHALHPICLQLIAGGLPAQMMETSELLHYAPALLDPATLVLAVSQSGRGVEVLQLLERTRGRVPLAAVTNTADSPLAAQAEAVFVTPAGAEASVSCKTFTAALAALAVVGRALAGEAVEPALAELATAPEAAGQYLADWEAHVGSAAEHLAGARYMVLAGRGPSLAAACNGALIIKEAALFPAEGMSCAAFRHGPLELISPEVFVLVFAGDERTAQLNTNLFKDIVTGGGWGVLVGTGAGPDAGRDAFTLPAAPAAALPILEILPAQMASLALALLNGHQAGVFGHASKVTGAE
jgi:glucosamine--fructose-6-phosphate aminotransferase (isomerizing)